MILWPDIKRDTAPGPDRVEPVRSPRELQPSARPSALPVDPDATAGRLEEAPAPPGPIRARPAVSRARRRLGLAAALVLSAAAHAALIGYVLEHLRPQGFEATTDAVTVELLFETPFDSAEALESAAAVEDATTAEPDGTAAEAVPVPAEEAIDAEPAEATEPDGAAILHTVEPELVEPTVAETPTVVDTVDAPSTAAEPVEAPPAEAEPVEAPAIAPEIAETAPEVAEPSPDDTAEPPRSDMIAPPPVELSEAEEIARSEAVEPTVAETPTVIEPAEALVVAVEPVEVPAEAAPVVEPYPALPERMAMLPTARPEPLSARTPGPAAKRPAAPRRAAPEPKEAPPARPARRQAATPPPAAPAGRAARQSPPAAASASARAASAGEQAEYGRRLARHVERYKRYPAAAARQRITGATRLAITIDRSGGLAGARVASGSGHAVLDDEALAVARRAAPYPRPPDGVGGRTFSFTVTLRFTR